VRTSDFEYDLPPNLIAQHPASPRDSARLLIFDRRTSQIEHRTFRDLPDYLNHDDILVLNKTRVIPARLPAMKIPTGGKAEILLLKRLSNQTWEVLVGGKGILLGSRLQIINGPIAMVIEELGDARRVVSFSAPVSGLLSVIGEMPTPPYIRAPLRDPEEYQTVYAQTEGSVAAPTAGLHFTDELLQRIEALGVEIVKVSLNIGLDTFAPVKDEDPKGHPIHQEWCHLSRGAAKEINQCKGRVIAVGTTSVRTLETAAMPTDSSSRVEAFEGETDLFILPGFDFKAVDALITNFHLPSTTLLMMISAFAGREEILDVYHKAVEEKYRFYSFGDAMLIL
jgi:S-adenosylmethionine:tRNA ribosyltransferase-isomerase